jgi:hypothetical protein
MDTGRRAARPVGRLIFRAVGASDTDEVLTALREISRGSLDLHTTREVHGSDSSKLPEPNWPAWTVSVDRAAGGGWPRPRTASWSGLPCRPATSRGPSSATSG